ncbi:hypothetical protein HG530_001189 [Fusarium avenaceum]|nr:hypothetical protein HG530_001189 [Fusarium avenaceum]
MDMERPQCGAQGAGAGEEYPLGTHVGGLFAVLAVSCLGAGFPVAAKKIKWLKMPPKVFFACKHFGTGVLVATAFVHLLPTAFGSLTNPCLPPLFTDIYPAMPGVIMMTAMLALFMVELYLNAKTGGHSHGGPTGTTITVNPPPPRPQRPFPETANFNKQHNRSDSDATVYEDEVDYEKAMARELYEKENQPHAYSQDYDSSSTMPAWFVVFYEQYIRQRSEMMDMIQKTQYASQAAIDSKPSVEVTESFFDEENQAVDPAVYKKMATHITLLEGGILFHSVFVGMTIAMTTDGLIVLLTAIMFHQMFEGLGLGSRIAAVPYPKGSIRPWILVFAFGCTAPIGQAIGIASRNSYDPEGELGLIMVGVFNSISSGLLIYAALVNLMVEDFLSEEAQHLMKKKDKIAAMAWLFLGEPLVIPVVRLRLRLADNHSVRISHLETLTLVQDKVNSVKGLGSSSAAVPDVDRRPGDTLLGDGIGVRNAERVDEASLLGEHRSWPLNARVPAVLLFETVDVVEDLVDGVMVEASVVGSVGSVAQVSDEEVDLLILAIKSNLDTTRAGRATDDAVVVDDGVLAENTDITAAGPVVPTEGIGETSNMSALLILLDTDDISATRSKELDLLVVVV